AGRAGQLHLHPFQSRRRAEGRRRQNGSRALRRLFLDTFQQRSIELAEFLRQTPRHSTLAFIISDAGAARGGVHKKRIDATRHFLEQLRARAPRILWLNPMPRSRWAGSSAMYLSFFVDMLE